MNFLPKPIKINLSERIFYVYILRALRQRTLGNGPKPGHICKPTAGRRRKIWNVFIVLVSVGLKQEQECTTNLENKRKKKRRRKWYW
jgi:hypothetical protein